MINSTGDILKRLNIAKTLYSKFDSEAEKDLSNTLIQEALDEVYHRGDRVLIAFIWLHFLLGFTFAFFYQTWLVFAIVGGLSVLCFHASVYFRPQKFSTRVLAGIILQAFVLLFIYQLHGQPEMRFFFFTSFTILIVYQDARAMWPSVFLFFGQMAIFAFMGSYVDIIPIFTESYKAFILRLVPHNAGGIDLWGLTFYIGISCLQVGLAGVWAQFLRRQTIEEVLTREKILTKQLEVEEANSQLEEKVRLKTEDLQQALESAQANEEELRQNMEELQATQDEMGVQKQRLEENQGRMEKVELELRKRQETMERSQWLESNLSRFDDIMRLKYDESLEDFSEELISALCELLEAVQGAFYVYNEDSESLKMTGGYACTPNSVKQSTFKAGEGVLGQIIKTRKTIHLENLPGEGVLIESALTQIRSKSLLIVPLIYNESLQGVLEIALLDGITELHQEFMQRLAQNVAATLQSIRGILRTQKLLSQSQEMTSKLRENARELEKTKLEVERRAQEFQTQFRAIDRSMLVLEYDFHGIIQEANENFRNLSGYSLDELKGKHYSLMLEEGYQNSKQYDAFWNKLEAQDFAEAEYTCQSKEGKTFWMRVNHYSLGKGKQKRVMVLAYNVSREIEQAQKIIEQVKILEEKEEIMHRNLDVMKELQMEVQEKAAALQSQLEAINLSTGMLEYDQNGFIRYVNDKFQKITGFQASELKGKEHRVLPEAKFAASKSYQRIWAKLKNLEFVEGEFQFKSKDGATIWLRGSYYPVSDKRGKLLRVLQLVSDISQEVRQEEQTKEYLFNLEKNKSQLQNETDLLKAQLEVFEQLHGVIELDSEGKIIDLNEQFLKITQQDREKILGKHHETLLNQNAASAQEYEAFWEKIHQNEKVESQLLHIPKNGQEMSYTEQYYPLQNTRKEITKIIGVLTPKLSKPVNGQKSSKTSRSSK